MMLFAVVQLPTEQIADAICLRFCAGDLSEVSPDQGTDRLDLILD
jgi:hypothetical protein